MQINITTNPLQTTAADILTLLHNFCDNLRTAEVTTTRKAL